MNVPPEASILEEVATEMGIDTYFVEKDWYVTQLLRLVSEFSFKNFKLVFSGGTALFKAHHLIKRFSEDADFRIVAPGIDELSNNAKRTLLSSFKHAVTAHVKKEFEIDDAKIVARNDNHFIGYEIKYPAKFARPAALRPDLKLEFTESTMGLEPLNLPVSSLFVEYAKKTPEVSQIFCIDPVENAADKISALTWRVVDRQRGEMDDDRAIVRHIHDLAALFDTCSKHPKFKDLALSTIVNDDSRSDKLKGMPAKEKFDAVLSILSDDKEYSNEYDKFVKGMSFAKAGEVPSFDQALSKLRVMMSSISS